MGRGIQEHYTTPRSFLHKNSGTDLAVFCLLFVLSKLLTFLFSVTPHHPSQEISEDPGSLENTYLILSADCLSLQWFSCSKGQCGFLWQHSPVCSLSPYWTVKSRTAGSWVFCSPLYAEDPAERLAHHRCGVNICYINDWLKEKTNMLRGKHLF